MSTTKNLYAIIDEDFAVIHAWEDERDSGDPDLRVDAMDLASAHGGTWVYVDALHVAVGDTLDVDSDGIASRRTEERK